MKNIKYILFTCTILMIFGCQDQLDLAPESAIGENGFYQNTAQVEAAVIAIYDGLQNVPLREFALTEMRSDNTRTKSREGDWAQFESLDVRPTNLAIGDYWSANYNVIFRANRVLENLDVVEEAELRSQFEGEARFARALSHFNLTRAFGGVPILDRVIIPTDTEFFGQREQSAVLAAIESDLTSAVELLPADMPFGRAEKGAAQALLGKVQLTQGNYSGAETVLNGLIASGTYALLDNYHDVFYSEGNDEIVFAIPYFDDDANESQDFSFEMTAGGVRAGLNYITDDFNANYNPDETIRTGTLYSPTNPDEVGKFITVSSDARLCGNDWIVLRHADVLLMYAEAIMAGGASTTDSRALDAFNQVRTRADMSEATELTKEMLLKERRTELAFENHRFYDLVRFGVAEEVLGAFATSIGETFTPRDLLLPIPQKEINVSGGALTQNPGY